MLGIWDAKSWRPLVSCVVPLHSLFKGCPIWHKFHPKIILDMGLDEDEVVKI